MTVKIIMACWLALLGGLMPGHAQAQARLALVIGNGAYQGGIPALRNPANDATAFAGVAQRLGFTTLLLLDARRDEMLMALRSFATAAKSAETAIIYYSGHGVEVGGRNFLLPIDFTLRPGDAPSAMDRRGVSLTDIDAALEGTAATKVLLIDACRNDPFASPARSSTAARGIASVPGTMPGLAAQTIRNASVVVYATGPGSVALDGVGAYSPFTTALLQSLGTAGQNLSNLIASVRSAVSDATSGVQVPTSDRAAIPEVSLLRRVVGKPVQRSQIVRVSTLARPAPAGSAATPIASDDASQPFQGLRLVIQPPPPAFPFYCRANAGRGWTKFLGGQATITVNRDGVACGVQIYGYPETRTPAANLVLAEQPKAGRVIIEGNSFAYVPQPGFVGTDGFRIEAEAVGHGAPLKMTGMVAVTVR